MLSDGVVVEEGTHKYLMELKTHYYNLVTRQTSEFELESDNDTEDSQEKQVEIIKEYDRKISYIEHKEVIYHIYVVHYTN